ncbi:unnamed protein product, partial [Schistosoma margrebowiei]
MVVGGSQQDYLQPPSKSQYIVPTVSSHLDWWPH